MKTLANDDAIASANHRQNGFAYCRAVRARSSLGADPITHSNERVYEMVRDTEYRAEVVAYRVFARCNGRDSAIRTQCGPRVRVNVAPDA